MVNIQDPENRGTMIFAWWMTCICDAYASAYYRRKPVLDDDDYDIDFYTADPVSDSSDGLVNAPSPREQLEVSSLRLIDEALYLSCVDSSHCAVSGRLTM
jgi:hypothetical protein